MKALLMIGALVLCGSISQADDVTISVEMDTPIVPTAESLHVHGRGTRVDEDNDVVRINSDFGEFDATYATLPNGNTLVSVTVPDSIFSVADFQYLTIEGFDSCMYGNILVNYPVMGSIISWLKIECPDVSVTGAMPAGATVLGNHVGNSNQSKSDTILETINQVADPDLTSLCSGSCLFGGSCLATDLSQSERIKWVMLGGFPVPVGSVPIGDVKVKFQDTNGNGIPDSYNLLAGHIFQEGWVGMSLEVECNCVDPEGEN